MLKKKKLKRFENAKINETLQYYAMKCLENMETGMTLSITIHDNEQIVITYWKE